MNKILLLLTVLLISFQISNSQPSLVTVSIKPDSSVTTGNMTFRCTIANPTNKKYRYLDFDSNCEKQYIPEFWKIVIKKDSTNYVDCSLEFILRNRSVYPEVKLYKNSIRTFDFCLYFDKLCPESEFPKIFNESRPYSEIRKLIKNYYNESHGVYEVQIFYLKDPFDPKNPLLLISNWTKINYIQN